VPLAAEIDVVKTYLVQNQIPEARR